MALDLHSVELMPNPEFVFPSRSVPERPALPNFTFNPASNPVSPVTPPHSPTLDAALTPRTARHRRGGSELIGTNPQIGAVGVVTNSPTRPIHSHQSLHLGPPPGRRHAHRRSGAISCHDLNSILNGGKEKTQAKCESAPTSPLEAPGHMSLPHEIDTLNLDSQLETRPSLDQSPQKRPPSRARVGFSEKIEYIRPLSIISSETESSISTIRGGHSVSGSYSSMISCEMSPPRMVRTSLEPVQDAEVEIIIPSEEPEAIEQKSRKRTFHWWDTKPDEDNITTSPPLSPLEVTRRSLDDQERNTTIHKPRKVKSWAHSLISFKSKSKKDPRPPTPPPTCSQQDSDGESDDSASTTVQSEFEPNFDEDNTVIIVNESAKPLPSPMLITNLPRSAKEITSPVIDLDAALGPFNTPPLSSNTRDFGRQPPRPRRSMHSLNQIHRRTESAPELVPFDHRSSFQISMPDVFEEEGEGEEAVGSDTEQQTPITPEQLPFTPGFGPSRRKKSEGLSISTSSSPRRLSIHSRERSSFEVVEDHEEPRIHSGKDYTGLPLGLPLPPKYIMTPDTMSDISDSPIFSPSQASLTTPRLGTASTSPEDYELFSFGEPGPEIRASVDDVPSLTSSTSTMTSSPLCGSILTPRPLSNGRAPSLISVQSTELLELRSRRRSIANLSRYVSSKLSMEIRPVSQHITFDEQKKTQRRHGLGKLMGFWKNKDGGSKVV